MKDPTATKKKPADLSQRVPSMFSLKLRRARHAARWNGRKVMQKEVAERLGVDQGTYWRWENGKTFPKENQIIALADLFDLEGDEIWIDTFRIPPDMHDFLTTTQEGAQVIRNIRNIMDKLEATQKPTTRKGLPSDEQILRSASRLGHRNPRSVASLKNQTGKR